MGNFDETKPKCAQEVLEEAIDELQEARFRFACFTGAFERAVEKLINESNIR